MKHTILALIFIFFSTFGYAQFRKGLKGPAAKNYKPWMDKTKSSSNIVMTSTRQIRLQGPTAKNYKPWKDERRFRGKVVRTAVEKPKLQGPRAKNYKPWRD